MMRILLLVVLSFVFSPALMAENKPDPRTTVESALDNAIALFEKKEFAKFLKECVVQEDLAQVLKKQMHTIDDLVKIFSTSGKETEAKETMDYWKACRSKTPTYNEAKNEASYPVIIKDGWKTGLVFEKHNTVWLMNLTKSASYKMEDEEKPK